MRQLSEQDLTIITVFLSDPMLTDFEIARRCGCSTEKVLALKSEWYGRECLPRRKLPAGKLRKATYRVPSRINKQMEDA